MYMQGTVTVTAIDFQISFLRNYIPGGESKTDAFTSFILSWTVSSLRYFSYTLSC